MTQRQGQCISRLWLVCTLLYALLIITLSLDHWVIAPPAVDSLWLIGGVRLAPLLLFAPGLLMRHSRAFVWLCFVLLFYFCSAIVYGWIRQSAAWMGWLQAAEITALFSCSLMYVRCKGRARRVSTEDGSA